MGCNGNCNSFGLAGRLGGGVKFGCGGCAGCDTGCACGCAAVGGMMGGGIAKVFVAATAGRGTDCLAVSFSSNRLSKFRRNPANFAFTVVAMVLMSRLNSADRTELILWGQEMCHKRLQLQFQRALICFFAARREDMSHHWTAGPLFVQIVAKWR
jgi:hypothetical protein